MPGSVVIGRGRRVANVMVTWPVVDVSLHFTEYTAPADAAAAGAASAAGAADKGGAAAGKRGAAGAVGGPRTARARSRASTRPKCQCKYCGKAVPSTTSLLKNHMAMCKKLPREVQRELDAEAIERFKHGAGTFPNSPLTKDFVVTGWEKYECTHCKKRVTGAVSKLARHLSHHCQAAPQLKLAPVTWKVIRPREHFTNVSAAGDAKRVSSKCNYCHKELRAVRPVLLRQHLCSCPHIPSEVRGVLDEQCRREAAAKIGSYRHYVYRFFTVKGAGVQTCNACDSAVRGGTHALRVHKRHWCNGVAAAWQGARVLEQFSASSGDGMRHCKHCAAAVSETDLMEHLSACAKLPADVVESVDKAYVAAAQAGGHGYATSAVYQHFQAVGRRRHKCRCGKEIEGDFKALETHAQVCQPNVGKSGAGARARWGSGNGTGPGRAASRQHNVRPHSGPRLKSAVTLQPTAGHAGVAPATATAALVSVKPATAVRVNPAAAVATAAATVAAAAPAATATATAPVVVPKRSKRAREGEEGVLAADTSDPNKRARQ